MPDLDFVFTWAYRLLLVPIAWLVITAFRYFFKLEGRLQRIEIAINLIADRLGIDIKKVCGG